MGNQDALVTLEIQADKLRFQLKTTPNDPELTRQLFDAEANITRLQEGRSQEVRAQRVIESRAVMSQAFREAGRDPASLPATARR